VIGHYLLSLTPEQEDRVLTTVLRPRHWDAPCLLGAIWPVPRRDCLEGRRFAGMPSGGLHVWESDVERCSVPYQFDELCERFGLPRVTAAIRARILRNRLWRALAPVSRETPVVVGADSRGAHPK
jgi:hypothetical protein